MTKQTIFFLAALNLFSQVLANENNTACNTKQAIWEENARLRQFKDDPQKFYQEQLKSQEKMKAVIAEYYRKNQGEKEASKKMLAVLISESECKSNFKQLNRK